MKKLVFAAIVCTALQGCAYSPYQYETNPELSLAANIVEDQTTTMKIDVGDGETGYDAKYHRGSIGTLFNLGLAVAGAANPIPGLPPSLSAAVHYSAGVDTGAPIHRQPLVFAYWPHSEGDDEISGGARFMDYVDEAVNSFADETGGSAEMITNGASGYTKINAWKYVSDSMGCPESNPCVLRANLSIVSSPVYQPAEWFIEHGDYEAMVSEVKGTTIGEGAKYPAAWGTVNNGGKNRSQLMFIQEGMDEREDMATLYAGLSRHLPSGVFLYVPPEPEFGMSKDYPFMLHEGKEVLFKKP